MIAKAKPWKPLRFGEAVDQSMRTVALHWSAHPFETSQQIAKALKAAKRCAGLYSFEGKHDAHRGGGVLYMGKSKELAGRVPKSAERFSWKHGSSKDAGDQRLFSDVWDVTLRLAEVASPETKPGEEDILNDLETLLIESHSPPFNAQNVRTGLDGDFANLLILNAGAKGFLLPAVCGAYYVQLTANVWPKTWPHS